MYTPASGPIGFAVNIKAWGFGAKPAAAYAPFGRLDGGTAAYGMDLFESPSIKVAKAITRIRRRIRPSMMPT